MYDPLFLLLAQAAIFFSRVKLFVQFMKNMHVKLFKFGRLALY